MRLAARCRIFLARHRRLYWLALATIAVAFGVVVNARVVALDEARTRWTDLRTVYVARHDHRPDDELSVDEIDLPAAAVPHDAVTEPPDASVARQYIGAGEVVVGHDVLGVAGPAERADAGTVVVAVTAAPSTSITVGVRVRVASEGLVLASQGVVVDVHDETVFVAVDDEVGAMVAHAAHLGTASLLFVP